MPHPQFTLRALLVAIVCFSAGAVLLGVAKREEEPLALWWSIPCFGIGIGVLNGRAIQYGLIGGALALFMSFAFMV